MFDFNVNEVAIDSSKILTNNMKMTKEFNEYQSLIIESDLKRRTERSFYLLVASGDYWIIIKV